VEATFFNRLESTIKIGEMRPFKSKELQSQSIVIQVQVQVHHQLLLSNIKQHLTDDEMKVTARAINIRDSNFHLVSFYFF